MGAKEVWRGGRGKGKRGRRGRGERKKGRRGRGEEGKREEGRGKRERNRVHRNILCSDAPILPKVAATYSPFVKVPSA